MKLNFDIKNKKGVFEADIEKIVEKGMDQHDKNWKDKFNTKYSAKKEMLEIKHKQKMEIKEKNQSKKNWFQKIVEEQRKKRELEIEEEKRKEEEKKKIIKIKIVSSSILGIVGGIMMCLGSILGSSSGNPDSGWYVMSMVGLFSLISIVFIWTSDLSKKK